MTFLFRHSRSALQRKSVPLFVRSMAERHPELSAPVVWAGFCAIAERERVAIQLLPLHRSGRLLRIGERVFVQINKALDETRRTQIGMHELCHFWRDDMSEMCYHASEEGYRDTREEFADIFAWIVTSPARAHVLGEEF